MCLPVHGIFLKTVMKLITNSGNGLMAKSFCSGVRQLQKVFLNLSVCDFIAVTSACYLPSVIISLLLSVKQK